MATLVVITLINLRGVRDTGVVFLFPTYLFVGCLVVAIGLGIWKTIAAGGHPMPVVAPPPLGHATEAAGLWVLRAGLFERLHGHDGRGSGQQRRDGVWRAARQKRANHPGHHHRHSDRAVGRNPLSCAAPMVLARPIPPRPAIRACSVSCWGP
jgi:hypothetical protein